MTRGLRCLQHMSGNVDEVFIRCHEPKPGVRLGALDITINNTNAKSQEGLLEFVEGSVSNLLRQIHSARKHIGPTGRDTDCSYILDARSFGMVLPG